MKKWFAFSLGLLVTGSLLYSAVQRNLTILQEEKVSSRVGSSETVAVEGNRPASPASGFQDQNLVLNTGADASRSLVEEATPAEVPARTHSFLERSFRVLELYREANRSFLNNDLTKAQSLFRECFNEAALMEPGSELERDTKNQFSKAIRSRLESVRFFTQVVQNPADRSTQTWWEKNIEMLKQANESITQAVWLTSQEIQSVGNSVRDGTDEAVLLEDLQRSAKGILVISKAAQS